MEKLDQYLDQVCRTIGGSAEMREHVRQELREHLLDAVAGHQAAGLTEAQAIDKALEEFGKVEEVRSELEAAHGQRRMMALVIDKAMQWKEKTMKAKWLWVTWAYLGLIGVILLEVLFITFNVMFIVPKFKKLMHDGLIDLEDSDGVNWMVNYLHNLEYVCGHYPTFMLLFAIAAIALFEWRVKSENKPFIRLSVLGTIAVGLMVVIMLMSGSLVITHMLGAPAMGRIAHPWTLEQVAAVDKSATALETGLAKKDLGDKEWKEMQDQVEKLSNGITLLTIRVASTSLSRNPPDGPSIDELRGHIKAAQEVVRDLRQAIAARDAEKSRTELARFRKSFDPVRDAAKRQPK